MEQRPHRLDHTDFLAGVPPSAFMEAIQEVFSSCGPVVEVKMFSCNKVSTAKTSKAREPAQNKLGKL
jgi:hypothetical protein